MSIAPPQRQWGKHCLVPCPPSICNCGAGALVARRKAEHEIYAAFTPDLTKPAHIWNRGLYCIHCGVSTILAQLHQPPHGVGPCKGNTG